MRYTVVVELQRVRTTNASATVLQRDRLRRFQVGLAAGETWTKRHRLVPAMTGDDLRVVYDVFRGAAPAEPVEADPYRSLHFWVNVTASAPTASLDAGSASLHPDDAGTVPAGANSLPA
jgi:hypothetical protein